VEYIIEKENEKLFEDWMKGLLPDKYYDYAFDYLDKKSSRYKAKIAHEKFKRKFNKGKKHSRIRKIVNSDTEEDIISDAVNEILYDAGNDYY